MEDMKRCLSTFLNHKSVHWHTYTMRWWPRTSKWVYVSLPSCPSCLGGKTLCEKQQQQLFMCVCVLMCVGTPVFICVVVRGQLSCFPQRVVPLFFEARSQKLTHSVMLAASKSQGLLVFVSFLGLQAHILIRDLCRKNFTTEQLPSQNTCSLTRLPVCGIIARAVSHFGASCPSWPRLCTFDPHSHRFHITLCSMYVSLT